MVAVLGSIIGPNGDGNAFANDVEALQTADWYSNGGDQGVLDGLGVALVAGQMAVDVAAGAALISRRDGSGNVQDFGYVMRNPSTARVIFGVASAATRNDALVAAAIDTTDGAIGAGVTAAGITTSGFHLLAVPGVSGTTTPRTDSQITTYLGRGGWIRLRDVTILSTDTQINTAASTPESVPRYDSGAITNAFTVASGWSMTSQMLRRIGRFIYFDVQVTRTGSDLTHSGTGNIANNLVATWSTARYPILFDAPAVNSGAGYVATGLAQSGNLYLTAIGASDALGFGEGVQLTGHWVAA